MQIIFASLHQYHLLKVSSFDWIRRVMDRIDVESSKPHRWHLASNSGTPYLVSCNVVRIKLTTKYTSLYGDMILFHTTFLVKFLKCSKINILTGGDSFLTADFENNIKKFSKPSESCFLVQFKFNDFGDVNFEL